MSTRGAVGFTVGGKTKIILSLYDSYPRGLGETVVAFISKIDFKRFSKRFKKMESLENNDKRLNNPIWNDLRKALNLIYIGAIDTFVDGSRMVSDEIFCQYYYLVDFDKMEFNVYCYGKECLVGTYNINQIPENWVEELFENENNVKTLNNHIQRILDAQDYRRKNG